VPAASPPRSMAPRTDAPLSAQEEQDKWLLGTPLGPQPTPRLLLFLGVQDSSKGFPERWRGGRRVREVPPGTGAGYGASKAPCASVGGDGDVAFVAAAVLCTQHAQTVKNIRAGMSHKAPAVASSGRARVLPPRCNAR